MRVAKGRGANAGGVVIANGGSLHLEEKQTDRSPSCAKRSVMLILMLVGPLSAFQVLV